MGHLQLRGQLIHILERRWRLHAAVLVTPATDAIQTFREILVLSLALGHLSTHFQRFAVFLIALVVRQGFVNIGLATGGEPRIHVVVQVRIHGEERQQFGMTGDFELNIEILRGFCLVRGQAIDFDCRLLCFQLALGHTLEHRAGLEDRSVYARVESDIICFGYRLLGGFGSRLLVCYACCGGFLICFGCGPLLIVRYVSCRLVGFRLGGCRLSVSGWVFSD